MDNQATPAAKVCRVCNQDVSKKPRQKDAQGRYVCQECLDKAKTRDGNAGRAAASADANGVDPGLAAALAGVDQTAMSPCPGCGTLLKPDAALCTNCGFDLSKGKAIKTRVQELSARERSAVEKPVKERRRIGVSITLEPGHVFTVLVLGMVGLAAYSYTDIHGTVLMGIATACMYYAALITMIVCAFKDEDGGWAILGILSLVFGVAYFGVLYYIFFRSDRGMVRALTFATFISFFLMGIVMFGHIDREMKNPTPASEVEEDAGVDESEDGADAGTEDPGPPV